MHKWQIFGTVVLGVAVMSVSIYTAIWLIPRQEAKLFQIVPTEYELLDGWYADQQGYALSAFRRSCAVMSRYPDMKPIGPGAIGGYASNWIAPCVASKTVDEKDHDVSRNFFQKWFQPYLVTYAGQEEGLLTGYYEPTLVGSLTPDSRFQTPILARPKDLITVALGNFRKKWYGERISGKLRGTRLEPFPSREDIESGLLRNQGLELVWADDPIDVFFLHIQGSGRISLPDGSVLRLGYDGQNGHPYTSIGRELIREGALKPEAVSMQSIKAWLRAHPTRVQELLQRNASFVFFHINNSEGPVGAQNVVLMPERSMAVDLRFFPLGAPIWVETSLPTTNGGDDIWHRLMIAQDTGGAIRGAIRGDIFWGAGKNAEEVAGRMKQQGRFYLLLPRVRFGHS